MKNKSTFDLYDKVIDNYDALKYTLLEAQTFDKKHFGFPPIYYKIMETDSIRVNAFVKAFAQYNNMKDAVVCEAGVGTLALTKHFLPYVKKAYLIENNPDLRDFISQEIEKMGFSHKVELIFGDAMQVQLPEKVDFIIGELMSIFCGNEYQVQIFKHLRQFLKPNGKLLPEKIINTAQLCNANFQEEIKHYPISFTRHFPEFLSLSKVVNIIDLYDEEDLTVEAETIFDVLLNGNANAIYMQSMVQVSSQSNFTGTDSLMPPTVCRLSTKADIREGEKISLLSKFTYGTCLDDADFSLKK